MKREVIALLIIIIVIVLTYLVTKPILKEKTKYSKELNKLINNKIDYEELVEVRYSNSGDMNGNIDEISFDLLNKKIIKRYSIENGIPVKITEYKMMDEDKKEIERIVKKYNFIGWKDIPFDDENIVLDASIINLYFKATNNNKIVTNSINYDSKIPDDGYPLLKEYTNYLFSLLTKENIIKEYEEI